MKKSNLETIQEKVAFAQNIPTAVIEYNIEELPKHDEITPTSFFGVKARRITELPLDTVAITYTM